jgi:hypothetical protein
MYDYKITKICGKKVIFIIIDTVIAAMRARAEWKGATAGVCRVTQDFTLGYDLKMGSPSFVIVTFRDWERVFSFTLSKMIGRSSRDQSLPKGMIFII